ncbi:MAG: hexosaminidase [Actinomycetota bacterium]|nr:hexosaminidase [Actinomycetota bacterium]
MRNELLVIPVPAQITLAEGDPFRLSGSTVIQVVSAVPAVPAAPTARAAPAAPAAPAAAEVQSVAALLADSLTSDVGHRLAVSTSSDVDGAITLELADDADADAAPEAYELHIDSRRVLVRSAHPAGLFAGSQTLRQLVAASKANGLALSACDIADAPRYSYRGLSLDVARRFFGVSDIERIIDHLALYKFNHLHLHLTDDQGWRLEIEGWPELTGIGASTSMYDGPGGFYTRDEYVSIVEYAQRRHLVIVPEVDLPGHVNAALVSYPMLAREGEVPQVFTGMEVGFSAVDVHKESTFQFVDDVVGKIAAMTPGPYLHVGGDEVHTLTDDEYTGFIERLERIVSSHGKRMIGWSEVAKASISTDVIAEYWDTNGDTSALVAAAKRGVKVIMAPGTRTYLDMKYDEHTALGQDWAGLIEVSDAYGWDPGLVIDGLPADAVLGVEAAIWTETLPAMADLEYMLFPRLTAVAEVAWSAAGSLEWNSFRRRLRVHQARWTVEGTNFYLSPEVSA